MLQVYVLDRVDCLLEFDKFFFHSENSLLEVKIRQSKLSYLHQNRHLEASHSCDLSFLFFNFISKSLD